MAAKRRKKRKRKEGFQGSRPCQLEGLASYPTSTEKPSLIPFLPFCAFLRIFAAIPLPFASLADVAKGGDGRPVRHSEGNAGRRRSALREILCLVGRTCPGPKTLC